MKWKWLYSKPEGMRFVDLCIYVDENFYKEGSDFDTIYKYLWIIANMLSCKAKYFNNPQDYQDFASYLAYSTYERMIDTTKPRVKSCLNYMKSIIYFRKNAYERNTYCEIIDPTLEKYTTFDTDQYIEMNKSRFEEYNHERLSQNVLSTLESIPNIVKENIPKIYRSDKITYSNIYISCLLSLCNMFTLPEVNKKYLDAKLSTSPEFNDVNYFRKHQDINIIRWHLDNTYDTIIKVVINKTNNYIVNEIKSLCNSNTVTDDMYYNIINSGFNERGTNEQS